MKKEHLVIGTTALAVAAALLVSNFTASAHFRGFGAGGNPEQRDAVKTAIENNDYEQLASLVAGTPLADHIDEAAFNTLVEAKSLKDQGKSDEARALLEEAGIRPPFGEHGFGPGDPEKHTAIREAIANNDYAAFVAATDGMKFGQEIDESEFAILVQAHELRAQGDFEGARALLQENELPPSHPHQDSR